MDQAALRAARDSGLKIGGWCPPGRASETGIIPPEFPLMETEEDRSPEAPDVPRSQRTEWNVRDADGVLVIQAGDETNDPGTDWAMECVRRYEKPMLIVDVDDPAAAERIRQWLRRLAIETLSVGGPSESMAPGIGERVYAVLKNVLPANGR